MNSMRCINSGSDNIVENGFMLLFGNQYTRVEFQIGIYLAM